VWSYPPEDEPQQGVRDVQLADLAADGEPELLVGFWGLAGVHAVSPAGETLWRNRSYPSIYSLAVTPPNVDTGWRKVLVTGTIGGILELNQYGREVPAYNLERRLVQNLYPARYGDGETSYCAIAENANGELAALGLAEGPRQQLVEIWSYPLPPAVMPQVESVASGKLLDGPGGQWLLATPDGSLHFIAHDAALLDEWRLGKQITGLAVASIDGRPAVVLSTEKEVAAWRVDRIESPP
jgi:hypothetical protein